MAYSRHDDIDSRGLLLSTVPGADPPSAEKFFYRLSVLGAHAVVDEDVEGGVDVGGDLQHPGQHEHGVLVATPRSHFWHEDQRDPAQKQVEQEQPRKLKLLLSNKGGGGERPKLF